MSDNAAYAEYYNEYYAPPGEAPEPVPVEEAPAITLEQQVAMYYARRKHRFFRVQEPLAIADVDTGPLAAWSAINSTSAVDTTGNGYTLTKNGGVTSEGDPIPTALGDWTVQALNAAVFDGSSGYLSSAAPIPAFDFGLGDFSVNTWLNPVSPWGTSATCGIIGQKLSDSYGGFQLYQDSGHPGTPGFRFAAAGGANQVTCYTTGVVATGAWTMLTFVRESGLCSWYLNGAFDSSSTPSPAVNITNDGNANFNIGYADTWGAFYPGAVWNAAIWSRALLLPDIAQLYGAPPVTGDGV